MNYKKIVAVFICLGSIASTQAMGGRILRGVGRLIDIAPLVITSQRFSDECKFNEMRNDFADHQYHMLLNHSSIKKIIVKDGRMVPICEDYEKGAIAYSTGCSSSPRIYLGSTIIGKDNYFEENPTWIRKVLYGKEKGDILEGYNGTYQQKMYEFILNHEVSHVNHNDSDLRNKERLFIPFVPALTYCSSRLLKVGRLKSLGIASLFLMAADLCCSFYHGAIIEKRCDLEACHTSGHALVGADLFDNHAKSLALRIKTPCVVSAEGALDFLKGTKLLSVQELQDLEDMVEAEKERQLLFDLDQDSKVKRTLYSLAKKVDDKVADSDVGYILRTQHPHPRVRAEYLREHAEKLRKEGK